MPRHRQAVRDLIWRDLQGWRLKASEGQEYSKRQEFTYAPSFCAILVWPRELAAWEKHASNCLFGLHERQLGLFTCKWFGSRMPKTGTEGLASSRLSCSPQHPTVLKEKDTLLIPARIYSPSRHKPWAGEKSRFNLSP